MVVVGGGVKTYTHGNSVPLGRRGGLGEVCFLLDPENLSPSPSHSTRPLLFPSRSLFMGSGGGVAGGVLSSCEDQQDGDLECMYWSRPAQTGNLSHLLHSRLQMEGDGSSVGFF